MNVRCLISALLFSSVAAAATPVEGWYGSVFGGYAYLPNNIDKTWAGLTRTDAVYESGFDAGGSIGFKSTPLRYEGELTYINANLDRFRVNGVRQTSVTGYSTGILTMANVFYDFPEMLPTLQPYLGVGIGYAWIRAQLNSNGPTNVTRYSETNSAFAYQPTAGVTYNFSENYALTVSYRYVGTTRVEDLGKIFQAHLANVGIVYRFDDCYK